MYNKCLKFRLSSIILIVYRNSVANEDFTYFSSNLSIRNHGTRLLHVLLNILLHTIIQQILKVTKQCGKNVYISKPVAWLCIYLCLLVGQQTTNILHNNLAELANIRLILVTHHNSSLLRVTKVNLNPNPNRNSNTNLKLLLFLNRAISTQSILRV